MGIGTFKREQDEEFETAGRFYPALHAFILAGLLQYQPTRATIVQVKALALLFSGVQPFFTCKCGDFTLRAKEVSTALSMAPQDLAAIIGFKPPCGGTNFPWMVCRQQDVGYAVQKSRAYANYNRHAKVILSCGWGMFLVPGRCLERYWDGELVKNWMDFVLSPSQQCALMMQELDRLLDVAGGDIELAVSMFAAGNDQPTKTVIGKQARMTIGRLISAGHKAT